MTAPGPAEHVPIEALLAHRGWVRALARSLYADRNRADDVEQETWRMAIERPPRHAESLRAWFGRVVRNAAVSIGRKERVRSARESAAPPRGPSLSPEDAVAAAELQTKLAREVLALDEPYRTTVVLRWFEGLEATEIAERLGVPVETVRTRLKRATRQLRERMDGDLGDGREDGGDAWCLLVFGVRARDVKVGAATGGVAAAIGGGLAMVAATKAAAACVVVAAGAAWWLWPGDAAREGGADTAEPRATSTVPAESPKPPPGKREPRARAAAAEDQAAAGAAKPSDASASAAASEVPLGPDVVHGRVVDDDTGAAVARVKVSLVWERARQPGKEPSAVTAADGAFRIAGAKDGTFGNLLLQADGYAECFAELPWRQQSAKLAKNDAGDVRIYRGRRIAGRVLAADGRTPVAGASLRLSTCGGCSQLLWIREGIERGTSAADGAFAIECMPPSPGWYPYTVFAVTKDGVGWTKLPGDAGRVDTAGVELVLRPSGAATVIVRDESGVPQIGAEVVASPRFDPLGPRPEWDLGHDAYVRDDATLAALLSTKTDERGVARFTSLPTIAEASRYDFVAYAKRGKGWKDATSVRAGEDAAVEVVVAAPRKRAIVGFVHAADGTPISGAGIKCGYAYATKIATGADGRFRIEVGEPATSWGNQTFVLVTAAGYGRVERSIKPDVKKDVFEVDIVLKPAAPIEGRVVDQDGKPVVGAWIGTPRDESSVNGTQVQSGADGRFVFPDTTAGEWRLMVRPPPPNDEWQLMPEAVVRGGTKDVVLVQPRVAAGKARVVAIVVDESGAPLAPDQARLEAEDEFAPVAHAAAGKTELGNGRVVVDRVKPGRWRVWVRIPGRIGAVVRVEVPDAQTEIPLRIVVGKPGALRGKIDVGETGLAMPTMAVPDLPDDDSPPDWAMPQIPGTFGAVKVAADGTFEFPAVMPGRWRVWARGKDSIGEGFADVPAGGEGTCVVTMTRPGTVTLRLVAAPPSVRVEVQIGAGTSALRRMLERDVEAGKTTPLDVTLCPGTYRWRVTFPAEKAWPVVRLAALTQEGEVRVVAGETSIVDVAVVPR